MNPYQKFKVLLASRNAVFNSYLWLSTVNKEPSKAEQVSFILIQGPWDKKLCKVYFTSLGLRANRSPSTNFISWIIYLIARKDGSYIIKKYATNDVKAKCRFIKFAIHDFFLSIFLVIKVHKIKRKSLRNIFYVFSPKDNVKNAANHRV